MSVAFLLQLGPDDVGHRAQLVLCGVAFETLLVNGSEPLGNVFDRALVLSGPSHHFEARCLICSIAALNPCAVPLEPAMRYRNRGSGAALLKCAHTHARN